MRVWLKKRKRKHGEYWALRWRAGGHMHYESLGRVSLVTKAEAKDARRDKEAELRHGAVATYAGKRLRMSEVDRAKAADDGKKRVDLGLATKHFIAAIGDLHVDRITPQHVVDFKAWLRRRPGLEGHKTLSEATVIKNLRSLRTLWNWAKSLGYVTGANPFTARPIGTPAAKDARYYTQKEIDAMTAVASDWWRLFLRVAYTTGLRRNEMLYLQWRDVDFEEMWVHVRERDEPLPFRVKTKASIRSVPVDQELAVDLQAAHLRTTSPYVFLTERRVAALQQKDELPNPPVSNMRRGFRLILKKAGIAEPWHSVHDLRKTCITNWANELPMPMTQRLAGHSNITTTAKYYVTTTPGDAKRIREALTKRRRAG